MVDDRNVEVHESGSTAGAKETTKHVGAGVYDLGPAGTVTVVGPPGMSPLATIHGAEHWIKIGATERRATEACNEYLGLLARMLTAFKAAYP
ncbi:MAG: hypothetical protein ACRENE_29465 [Polyangiaceae bacterium]